MIQTIEMWVHRLTRAARRYWQDPEKFRAYSRAKMKGKQTKASMAPEAWRRRLDMARAAQAKRDQDPNYRAARLAKQRAYYHARKSNG